MGFMDPEPRKTVTIIGARGQLGSALSDTFEHSWYVSHLTSDDVDVRDPGLHIPKAEVVINCAAYHNFTECENNPRTAFSVNAVGAMNVAKITQIPEKLGPINVYISTDYVFSHGGYHKPYDRVQPASVYAASKAAGETLVRQYSNRALVVRLGALFGGVPRGKGPSFVDQVLQKTKVGDPFDVVYDQFVSPAYTRDAAREVLRLCEEGKTGIYHLSNTGRVSYYDFALEIVHQAGLPTIFRGIPSNDPRRPRDCSTVVSDRMRPWQMALHAYLEVKREAGELP